MNVTIGVISKAPSTGSRCRPSSGATCGMATTGVGVGGAASVAARGVASCSAVSTSVAPVVTSPFVTGVTTFLSAGAAPKVSRRVAASNVHAIGGSAGAAGSSPVSEWTSDATRLGIPTGAMSTEAGGVATTSAGFCAAGCSVTASAVAVAVDTATLGFGVASAARDSWVVLAGFVGSSRSVGGRLVTEWVANADSGDWMLADRDVLDRLVGFDAGFVEASSESDSWESAWAPVVLDSDGFSSFGLSAPGLSGDGLSAPVFDSSLVDGARVDFDAAPGEPGAPADVEPAPVVEGSADATPCPVITAAPMPRATASPPIRPTYAPAPMPRCLPCHQRVRGVFAESTGISTASGQVDAGHGVDAVVPREPGRARHGMHVPGGEEGPRIRNAGRGSASDDGRRPCGGVDQSCPRQRGRELAGRRGVVRARQHQRRRTPNGRDDPAQIRAELRRRDPARLDVSRQGLGHTGYRGHAASGQGPAIHTG